MASFATPQLLDAWNDRKIDLKLARMQKYNDLLYARLTERFTRIRAVIDARLHAAVAGAMKASDLYTTIYNYRYDHTVQDMTDLYPVSYSRIIYDTDLCERLSVFFGAENFVVRAFKEDGAGMGLRLHYYPYGVDETHRLHAERVMRDHVGRAQAFVRDIEWIEDYSYRQEGGYSTPSRPATTIAPPPPPARPSYARDYEDADEAVRNLVRECYCQHDSDSE